MANSCDRSKETLVSLRGEGVIDYVSERLMLQFSSIVVIYFEVHLPYSVC